MALRWRRGWRIAWPVFQSFSAFTPLTLALVVLIAGVAGLARGFAGFGAALIFVPAASALVTPAVAAPVLLLADGVMSLGLLPRAWLLARKREAAIMAAGALVGVPLGTFALRHGDPEVLRWAIAGLAGTMLVLLASGWRYHGTPRVPVTVGVGALSGLFGGLAQLAGPPVVAYWLSGRSLPAEVRANIILYFAATTVFSTVAYLATGLLSREAVSLAVLAAPSYALGLFLGARLFGKADESFFRRLCFALIAISVVTSLPVWG